MVKGDGGKADALFAKHAGGKLSPPAGEKRVRQMGEWGIADGERVRVELAEERPRHHRRRFGMDRRRGERERVVQGVDARGGAGGHQGGAGAGLGEDLHRPGFSNEMSVGGAGNNKRPSKKVKRRAPPGRREESEPRGERPGGRRGRDARRACANTEGSVSGDRNVYASSAAASRSRRRVVSGGGFGASVSPRPRGPTQKSRSARATDSHAPRHRALAAAHPRPPELARFIPRGTMWPPSWVRSSRKDEAAARSGS